MHTVHPNSDLTRASRTVPRAIPIAHLRVRLARWQAVFLRELRKSPNVSHACRKAKIASSTAYRVREREGDDSEFVIKWNDALNASVDRCEEKAFDMAWKGDSQLLQFILKAHRPAIYRERSEVAVAGGVILIPAKSDGKE